jgi:hypothetical protein
VSFRWGVRKALLAIAVAAAFALNAGTAAAAPIGDWDVMGDCPVDAPSMLAVAPGGLGSGCLYFGMDLAQYNLGHLQLSEQVVNLFSTMEFGVAGATAGDPAVGQVVPATDGNTQHTVFPLDWEWLIPYEGPTSQLWDNLCNAITHSEQQYFACLGRYYQLFVVDPGPILIAHITMELAGTPSDFSPSAFAGTGDVLTVPVKFQLQNLLLGNNCSVGSDRNPIVLKLDQTTPPNYASSEPDPNGYPVTLTESSGGAMEATGFSEPKATGCGPGGLLDSLVNGKLGLPSPASANSFSAIGDSVAAWTTAGGSALSQAWHAEFG